MTMERRSSALLLIIALLVGFEASLLYQDQFAPSDTPVDQPDETQDRPANVTVNQYEFNVTDTRGDLYNSIFQSAKDSVVSVRSLNGDTVAASGSGFIYDSRGRIVTNNHVVEGASSIQVRFLNGNVYPAEVIGTDPYTDLAVLDIDVGRSLPALPLGNSTQIKIGESVLAIGNPFGLSGSMTAGIVSQKGRTLPAANQFSIPNVIQTDAAINPGNSGGPLLNVEGEVIGINTAIDTTTQSFQGVGFAVPVNAIRRVVPALIEDGEYKHPWIGISGINVNPAIAEEMGLENATGFLVASVQDGSPAQQAGLQAGDRNATIRGNEVPVGGDVVVGIDGEPVRQLADVLAYLATEVSVGDTIELTIIRDGDKMTVPLTLESRPPAR